MNLAKFYEEDYDESQVRSSIRWHVNAGCYSLSTVLIGGSAYLGQEYLGHYSLGVSAFFLVGVLIFLGFTLRVKL